MRATGQALSMTCWPRRSGWAMRRRTRRLRHRRSSTRRISLRCLAAVAFDCPGRSSDAVYIEGIRHISPLDIEYADDLGYRIKLLGHRGPDGARHRTARASNHGRRRPNRWHWSMASTMPSSIEGDTVGRSGACRAGVPVAGPTASAVVADLIDHCPRPPDGRRFVALRSGTGHSPPFAIAESMTGRAMFGCMVADQPGVIADIASELRNETVSRWKRSSSTGIRRKAM